MFWGLANDLRVCFVLLFMYLVVFGFEFDGLFCFFILYVCFVFAVCLRHCCFVDLGCLCCWFGVVLLLVCFACVVWVVFCDVLCFVFGYVCVILILCCFCLLTRVLFGIFDLLCDFGLFLSCCFSCFDILCVGFEFVCLLLCVVTVGIELFNNVLDTFVGFMLYGFCFLFWWFGHNRCFQFCFVLLNLTLRLLLSWCLMLWCVVALLRFACLLDCFCRYCDYCY